MNMIEYESIGFDSDLHKSRLVVPLDTLSV
jgi:hypothetical protein